MHLSPPGLGRCVRSILPGTLDVSRDFSSWFAAQEWRATFPAPQSSRETALRRALRGRDPRSFSGIINRLPSASAIRPSVRPLPRILRA
jgi:hypothetical protein